MAHNRRKKGPSLAIGGHLTPVEPAVKCVDLQRTRHGFGFTLSGEMPSILTQVKGGAHLSGLRSGDFLLTVNDIDVLHMTHEDIVELIKRSGLCLRLQCLENGSYYSSNSDDSDLEAVGHYHHTYHNPVPHREHRHRNKPPVRHRKTLFNNRCNSNENLTTIPMTTDYSNRVDALYMPRASLGVYTNSQYQPNPRPPSKLGTRSRPIGGYSASKTNEPILDLLLEQKLSQIKCSLSESDSNNSCKTNSFNNKNGFDRTAKKSSIESNSEAEVLPIREPNGDGMKANTTSESHLNNDSMSSEMSGEEVHSRALLRAIVGYLGTIEMPAESHIDSYLIKNCIRRIKVENKLQTIILLAVYQESILLVNINGQTIAQFSAENLKSCGICSDDTKFFAIITSNTCDSHSYSCHVFTTSASVHQTHYKTAQNFGIKCTLDPVTSHCLEFPENSDSILRVIVGLYRHKVGCAPTALANVNRANSAANGHSSDSGINDFVRMDPIGSAHNTSYNTERLEQQLNPSNVRNTVNKYLKLKQEMNVSRIVHNEQPSSPDMNDCSTLTADTLEQTMIAATDRTIGNKFNDFATSASMCASKEISSNDKMKRTNGAKNWVTPATLSKENLELNNEITSGYDCETKSSMSLEGMAPMSDTVSASASVVSERPIDVGWVGGWAQDFEKLMSDSVGIKAFAEFLRKEFSHENLQFWMSCEKYKKLTDPSELKIEAKNIFDRHLCSGAPEPVNVDGRVRLFVETGLDNPGPLLFSAAEKHIYNLMKFDCYQRFLKSDIYKECVTLELQGKPLLYETDNQMVSEEAFKTSNLNTIKPKKRSFIPWHRLKTSKAEKQQLKHLSAKQTYVRKTNATNLRPRPHSAYDLTSNSSLSANRSDVTGSQSSIASSEPLGKQTAILSKSSNSINKINGFSALNGHHCHDDNCHLFRVILPDHSQAVVPLMEGQKIGQMIEKLLQKRSLNYSSFDAFVTGSEKALDLDLDVSTLGCNEIRVEQRILFQIDFPNREVIGIKARTSKTCGEVFGPLLIKYGYKLEHIILQIANSSETVTNDMPIIKLDNQKVIVCLKDDLEEWGWDCRSSRLPVAVDKKRNANCELSSIQVLNASIYDMHKPDGSDQSPSNSPEKENRYPQSVDSHSLPSALKTRRGSNTAPKDNVYNDISFSDDTKSEAFFRELMLATQHTPHPKDSLAIGPKLNATQPKTCAKSVSNSQTNGLSLKPIPRTINSNKDINLSECDLPAIDRLNSRTNHINDIDLDVTLKSIQLYNMRNEGPLTPSAIPYPPHPNDSLSELSAANFTPPAPVHSMPLSSKQCMQLALQSAQSSPPPLPPKAVARDRGPPPRPPISRLAVSNHLIPNSNQNKNSFVQNIDQIIDSNVSFV